MRLPIMALALSTLCLTGCAERQAELRAVAVTPDPAALDACPERFPLAPQLVPLAPFALPDGRQVVLLDTVLQRETLTARYIISGRGAWHECRSAVAYVQDWGVQMRAGSAVRP